MLKKVIVYSLTILFSRCLMAQMEESSFSATGRGGTATSFVTDYQALGINPANLGFDTNFGIALGVAEMGYTFYSDALLRDDVRQIIFSNADSISYDDQQTVAHAFLDAGINFQVDVMPVGLSFKIPKIGTLAFSYKASSNYHTVFKGEASQIIFEGYNYADYIDTIVITPTEIYGVAYEPLSLGALFDGTEISFNVNSEVNLGFGRKLFGSDKGLSVYGGVGVKYVTSYAYLDITSEGGVLTGVSALGLDLLDLQTYETPSPITTSTLQPVGHGWGFDFGVSAKVTDALTVGAALTDIGSVKYTANVLQINDFVLDTIRFSGMTTTDPVALVTDILGVDNLIAYSGLETFSVALPTKLRLGGSLKVNDFLDLGVDAVFPTNTVAGSLENPIVGAGAELTLLKVVKLSAGISAGGGYSYNIPAGFGLDFRLWELGIATRDVLTWFGEASPTVSFAAGVARFKF